MWYPPSRRVGGSSPRSSRLSDPLENPQIAGVVDGTSSRSFAIRTCHVALSSKTGIVNHGLTGNQADRSMNPGLLKGEPRCTRHPVPSRGAVGIASVATLLILTACAKDTTVERRHGRRWRRVAGTCRSCEGLDGVHCRPGIRPGRLGRADPLLRRRGERRHDRVHRTPARRSGLRCCCRPACRPRRPARASTRASSALSIDPTAAPR